MTPIHVVGAAILSDGQCLVARRGPGRSFAGKWEFPGGKVELGEHPTAALAREILEELALQIEVGSFIAQGTAAVLGRPLVLDVFAARILSGSLLLHEHSEVRWVRADLLPSFDWADADVPIVQPVCAFIERTSLSESARSRR